MGWQKVGALMLEVRKNVGKTEEYYPAANPKSWPQLVILSRESGHNS